MSLETLRRIRDYHDAEDDAMDRWAAEMSEARGKKLGEPELKAAADASYEQFKTLVLNGASNSRRDHNGQLTFGIAMPNAVDTVIPEVVLDVVMERFRAIGFTARHIYNDGTPSYDTVTLGLPSDWVQRLTSSPEQNK